MANLKIGINGFGRIGRLVFRAAAQQGVEVVGVNDLMPTDSLAHLLKYDSAHGHFPGDVSSEGQNLVVNGKNIPVSSSKDPAEIPWNSWGADMVLECSGAFKKLDDLKRHLKNANRVLVSAPTDADKMLVFGVNHEEYDPAQHKVVSNASCTTNCLAPVAKVLHETFGIEKGQMTTIHAYTNDQRILDTFHSDPRRSRAAAVSMIPTSTGAAKAVGKVLPELNGLIDGMAMRVPTQNVSVVDFVAVTKKEVTVDSVNNALCDAAGSSLKGVLECSNEPLVSIDYNGNPASSSVDLACTMVVGKNMVKVLSWYDNEMGYSNRMIDMARYMVSRGN